MKAKGRHKKTLDQDLLTTVTLLAQDTALPGSYRDHGLPVVEVVHSSGLARSLGFRTSVAVFATVDR